jgi:hypothetical protein
LRYYWRYERGRDPEELDRRELQEEVYCGRLSSVESFNECAEVVREQWRLEEDK